MTTNAARNANFDAFDREPPRRAAGGDPLAELARIVGQDDPFRALLAARDGKAPAAPRIEPALDVAPERAPEPVALRRTLDARDEPARAASPPAEPLPVDAFDHYLAEVERTGAYPPNPYEEAAAPEPGPVAAPRARRRLVSVGVSLGIIVAAVAGGLTWRNLRSHPVGADGAPVVLADKAPLKVPPVNAGGAEIPDQNRQIYERGAKDGQTRVVNREEQPVDVAQVARAAAARDAAPGAAPNALSESLGEPRRVRTVSVRPDVPEAPRPANPPAAPAVATATPSPMPTMTMPSAPQTPPARPARPAPTTVAAPEPATTAAAPRAPAARTTQRVASASPEAGLPAPVAAPAAGGFAVQIAVRPTDNEARVAFRQIQERYSAELGGRSPIIRQAEVNGKTVYRIRVSASSLDDANGLCGKLKSAGGQCFVAKN